jgi:DNA-binding transcriptional MerR regulator
LEWCVWSRRASRRGEALAGRGQTDVRSGSQLPLTLPLGEDVYYEQVSGEWKRPAENDLLKIGDFSKLAQVSVKTLRHYGKVGLLTPAWVDRFTRYRYYTLDQLPRLNRILALKDLGFSLPQVRELLREDLSAAELRGMIRMKHAEVERQVQAEAARLARVTARLRQIEREGRMPDYEVALKTVPSQRVVGIREVVPAFGDVRDLFNELRACLRAGSIPVDPVCPSMAIYYDSEYHDPGIDVEAALPI